MVTLWFGSIENMCTKHALTFIYLDAVGTKRYESNSGGEREIQRTMLELLNQLDGFDYRGDVKVIMATNRIETLDPALIRPGLHFYLYTCELCM